jgi:hypothetical protein
MLYSGTRHKLELFIDRPKTDVAHKHGHKFYSRQYNPNFSVEFTDFVVVYSCNL